MNFLLPLLLLVAGGVDEGEWADHKRANPKVVEYALSSPDRAWEFILAPDSPYAERRAVAVEAGKVLDWSYLTRIHEAREELSRNLGAYAPGAPLNSGQRMSEPQNAGENVTILGQTWTVPGKRAAHPDSFEARSESPWPWQVNLALNDLWMGIFRHGEKDSFYSYLEGLPCKSEAEATFFQKTTTQFAMTHREALPLELIGAWRNLLLRTDKGLGNALGAFFHTWALRFDDRDAWAYAHVMLLDRIEAGDVYGASGHLYQLRERINENPGQEKPGPIPYTATLAVAQRALSDESLSGYVRVMAGLGVARALNENYLPQRTRLASTVEKDQPEIHRLFVEWFTPREKAVKEGAAAEAEALEAARKALSSVGKCASGETLSSH